MTGEFATALWATPSRHLRHRHFSNCSRNIARASSLTFNSVHQQPDNEAPQENSLPHASQTDGAYDAVSSQELEFGVVI